MKRKRGVKMQVNRVKKKTIKKGQDPRFKLSYKRVKIAKEVQPAHLIIPTPQSVVTAIIPNSEEAVSLLSSGLSVPFVARYRQVETKLTESAMRQVADAFERQMLIYKKKQEIVAEWASERADDVSDELVVKKSVSNHTEFFRIFS